MPSKFKFGKVNEKVSRGFTQKSVEIIKGKDTRMSLGDAKEIEESFKKNSGDNSKFVIRGRNKYGTTTIRGFDGRWYNEDDDYYNARGYEKTDFEQFYRVQIVYLKS
jgi:hypothetical protein